MSQNQPTNTPPPDWRELRRQEREQRRADRREWRGNGAWILGAIFILLGVALILQNLGALALHNWWALFILIPAAGSFAAAWGIFTNSGGVSSAAAIGPFVVGLILLAVTAVFLFDLTVNWGLVGPLLLILVGISALFGGLVWRR